MQVVLTDETITTMKAGAAIVGVFEGEKELRGPAMEVDRALAGAVGALLEGGDLKGKCGETAVLYPGAALPVKRVVVAGLGRAADLTAERCREAGASAARRAHRQGARSISATLFGAETGELEPGIAAQAAVEGILMGLYRGKNHKSGQTEMKPVMELSISAPGGRDRAAVDEGIRKGQVFADAVCTARDLVNQPANHLTPTLLGDVAQAMAMSDGLTCRILEEKELAVLKMGAFLGVARGSSEPPKFIILEHKSRGDGGEERPPCVVLVGKGITFDSGGICLKARDRMEPMKADMAGAAAVISAVQGAARLELPLHVVALAPAGENLPSGTACKPGDVLTAMNGKTIEVVNTDAEGRLILADALCYAARYEPDVVIDVATLTGACVIALGEEVAAGIFSNDDALYADLFAAGEFNGERLWRLPLYEAYREKIKSEIADMKNAGGRFGGVGSSAIFLKEFVSYPWAHIDIAGMAVAKNDAPYIRKGSTGFGVRTLLSYLMKRAKGGA